VEGDDSRPNAIRPIAMRPPITSLVAAEAAAELEEVGDEQQRDQAEACARATVKKMTRKRDAWLLLAQFSAAQRRTSLWRTA
jgi:hypothetical protein